MERGCVFGAASFYTLLKDIKALTFASRGFYHVPKVFGVRTQFRVRDCGKSTPHAILQSQTHWNKNLTIYLPPFTYP